MSESTLRDDSAVPVPPDELHRRAISLLERAGMTPERAAELAGYLLWFDVAGQPEYGLSTLPAWLERLHERKEIDPRARPRFEQERGATAVVDGNGGPGPCTLYEAARAAANKARETGSALVRVRNVGVMGPPAPIAAELAIGPISAGLLAPDGAWAIAMPSGGGPPAVVVSATIDGHEGPAPGHPWSLLLPAGDWLIQAVAVPAIESLSSLQERLQACASDHAEDPRVILPEVWEARRRDAHARGLTLSASTRKALTEWSARLPVLPNGPGRPSISP